MSIPSYHNSEDVLSSVMNTSVAGSSEWRPDRSVQYNFVGDCVKPSAIALEAGLS